MNTSNCSKLENLNDQTNNEDENEDYQARYIDAILECFPALAEELAAAQKEGRDPVDVANFIAGEMSQSSNPALEIEILEKLIPITEKKQPVRADQHKDNLADVGADPVMMYKGQFIHNVDDIRINGAGIDFVFSRRYRNQTIFNGPLGYNWTHNFHVWLREGSSSIFLSTGDFREEAYIKHPRFGETMNNEFDYWMPPDGSHGVFFAENGSYVLRQPNGARQIFEVDPKHSFLHRLAKIEDRFGNHLTLSYDPATDQLKDIEINHSGRYVQFAYDTQNRICSISDYTNRQWHYTYDSIGDLIAVTSPLTDRYKCGPTVCYEYSSTFQTGDLQHNLTRIIDAAGQIYLETEYGSSPELQNYNRVTRQRQGGGQYQFTYEIIDQVFDADYPAEQRPTNKTTLIERNGQSICHIYNKFGNLLQREQCVIENGLLRKLIEQYRYDRDGNVVSSLSPEGVLTQHMFGRDYFTRHHPLMENGDIPTEQLTWKERQAFSRILAKTRRGGYANFNSFTLPQGIWGNFPDILNGHFPATIDRSQDIIVKMTYEDEFGQLLTISDPRYTESADPDANEFQSYDDTLTKYSYTGLTKLLSKVEYPQPHLHNGQPQPIVVELFTDYDSKGRLLRSINPVGVVTQWSFFEDQDDLSFGHLRQIVVDVGGFEITVRNEVDELGRITAVHAPKSVAASDGRFVTHTSYNELDQVIETISTAPFNFRAQKFYDRTGKLERLDIDLKDEFGQAELGGSSVVTFCYDEEFNLVKTTTGGIDLDTHLATKHVYDSAGQRILTISPKGNQVRTCYNERQLPASQTTGAGSEDAATTRIEYDGDGRVHRSFDALGNPTTFEFDVFGRAIATVDALGHITRTDYDKASNVTCVRFFEKQFNGYFLLSRSETEYDELNRAIRNGVDRFEEPLGPFLLSQLDTIMLDSPNPAGLVETKTVYDANSRVVKTVDPLGREVHFAYDNLDRPTLVTDSLGNQTLTQYDEHNNVIRTDQIGSVLAEDDTEISKRFFASSSTFDELDRMTSQTDSLGNTTRLFYDSRDNMVRLIDPLGNETKSTFDVYNRLIKSTNFLTDTGIGPVTPAAIPVMTKQEYDLNNNLISVIDALGRKTRYEYDALDRRRAIIYPNDSKMLTDYDKNSNVIRTQDDNGLQRFFTLDALNRTIRIDVNTINLSTDLVVAGATFERYEYDGLDRLIMAENDFAICSFRYNSLSWQLQETITYIVNEAPLKTPFTTTRKFNDVGALTDLTYPSGRSLHIDRDDLNRRTNTQNIANGINYPGDSASIDSRPIAQMIYAGLQPDQCIFANGASASYRHDGGGRLIEIAHSGPNATHLIIQYLYDAANNVRIRNDVLTAGPRTERFAYDSIYRLAHEFKPDTAESFDFSNFGISNTELANPLPNRQSTITTLIGALELPQVPKTYDYDLVGNRDIERTSDGNIINYNSNQLDQYTSRGNTSYTYDDNGNLKDDQQRFSTYDSLNRLVQVCADKECINEIAVFWHDALGRRILEQLGGHVTQLVSDGDDVITEYRDGNLFAQYVYDDGIDSPLHIAAEGAEHWYHAGLVGSIRLLTDANGDSFGGYRYTPFGELVELPANEIFNPWRYTARRFDVELETYDYRARQYNPKVGRFVQRDPEGMVDGTNLYSYAINKPLMFSDPNGTDSRPENNHSSPLDWNSIKDAYNSSTYPKKGLEFIYDTLSNNSLGAHSLISNIEPAIPNLGFFDKYTSNLEVFGRYKITKSLGRSGYKLSNAFDDSVRYFSRYNDKFPNKLPAELSKFFNAKWFSKYGSINKLSAWLGPIGMYSNGKDMLNPDEASDYLFAPAGFVSSLGGTAGLAGIGLNSIGMTALAKPLLIAASKLNPVGLVLGAFAGGGLAGQYLDDKTGWSDSLANRARLHEDQYENLGFGWASGGFGAVSTLPVASEVGNALGWGAFKTYQAGGITKDYLSSRDWGWFNPSRHL